jgi:hypothetical protein
MVCFETACGAEGKHELRDDTGMENTDLRNKVISSMIRRKFFSRVPPVVGYLVVAGETRGNRRKMLCR